MGFIRNFLRRAAVVDGGGAAVEFAFVFPVALVFFCGLLAYGMYFGAAHSVQQLAADAARASVSGLDNAERTAIARTHVEVSGGSYPFLRADRISVRAEALEADPSQFRVHVSFNSEDLPIWALSGLIPLPRKTIERVAVIKRGGY